MSPSRNAPRPTNCHVCGLAEALYPVSGAPGRFTCGRCGAHTVVANLDEPWEGEGAEHLEDDEVVDRARALVEAGRRAALAADWQVGLADDGTPILRVG